VVTDWLQKSLRFDALSSILLRMAKKAKRPELTHCKVSQTNHPRARWRVFFTTEEDGKRKRVFKSFATEEKAWSFAEKKDLDISNHGVRFGDIPAEVRRAFDYFRDESAVLRGIGAEVPRFEDLVSTALADIRARHHESAVAALPVAEAVEKFIDYKRSRVGPRQLNDLKDRLKRFAIEHGDKSMPSITTTLVESWLGNLRSLRNPGKNARPALLAPLTRNHYRATLHALFEHASAPARGWCPRNVVSELEPELVASDEPEAYSPEDAGKIMQAALDHKPQLVPLLALGFFAGLRVSEAEAFDLGKLDMEADGFRVGHDRKTGARIAPFTPACKEWILSQPRRKGRAWLKCSRSLVDEVSALIALAGVEQIDNGARHSFISYRCAETRDIAAVADECGNSVGTIKKHYRHIVTAAEASKYFAIRPETEGEKKAKITSIETGRMTA